MNKKFTSLFCTVLVVLLGGCTLPFSTQPAPTMIAIPSPTPAVPTRILPTPSMSLPTVTLGVVPPTGVPTSPVGSTPTQVSGVIPGLPSGPYGVLLVTPGDVLNIRTGAGAGYPVSGSFPYTANNVMRTGPSAMAGGDLWVQVQNPGGGTGWVNSQFLTEYTAPSSFCTDDRVTSLIANFGAALATSNGSLLSVLVSPAHGVTVRLWRFGIAHTFKQADARWVFESTYKHNWGSAPAMGMDTIGSFHDKVLPFLQEVLVPGSTNTCDSLGNTAQYGTDPWPLEYTNVNFYTVLKPGTPGVDLDFRYWLVGVEYFQGQPFVFALIHFAWEP